MREIIILPHFKRALKPLVKKHRTLLEEVKNSLKKFDPANNIKVLEKVYKLRITVKSLNRGKSGAFRLFILVTIEKRNLGPITIYAKSEKGNLPRHELDQHLELVNSELKHLNMV